MEGCDMLKRLFALGLLAGLVLVLGACAPSADDGDGAAGVQPERGLTDFDGSRVEAAGVLEWVELEGGFWAVTRGATEDDQAADVIVVLANGDEFRDELAPLEGRDVVVTGTRLDGVSIRMAGPEIEMDSIEELSDSPAGP